MTFATGGFAGVNYVEESTFGVTPSTPTMIALRQTGTSLVLSKDSFASEELRSDRKISDLRHGTQQVGGDLNFELSYGEFDTLMEAALFNTWSTNVLKDGVTEKFFTLERAFADITQYGVFTGCYMNTFNLNVASNAIVTGSFGVVGKGASYSGTPLDASPTPSLTASPFDSFTGTLDEGGATIAVVTSVDITVDNGITPTFVVGSNQSARNVAGRSTVTGTVTAYFEDAALLNKFINETESSLSLTLGDGISESYVIEIPRLKYSGGDNSVADEGPVELSMPFQGLYDSGEDATIKITRIP